MTTNRLFVTELYRAPLAGIGELNADLLDAAKMLAKEDKAGRAWCKEHGYQGYTSYASLDDLPQRATCFEQLVRVMKPHVEAFAGQLQMDLRGKRLKLDNIWVNVLEPGGSHTGHIHPHCVLSGTYYVRVPDGASSLKFEDPRLPMMMAAPAPREDADEEHRRFVYVAPKAGDLLLWESWLRHEVPPNRAASSRVSVSFNYRL
ncbi:MAG TPA: TIGR02466 family protein [Hyphomonadaceae bacterium]|nr:TIGR02466 family protein [Hyphomonadaceae bacterium]